jgi:predicted nucleotidyltransferase/predicted transcriptional regulator
MWKNYNKYRVLKVFFDDPLPQATGFQLRELSRKIKLAPKSVSIYLKKLEKEGLIKKEKHRAQDYSLYYANRDSKFYLYKKLDLISSINEIGLLDYLYDQLMPECIILFGSASRGEDTKESDIDLFIQCNEKKLELSKFEKQLNRRMNIFYSETFNNLSGELKNNIINGVILKGYLKVF